MLSWPQHCISGFGNNKLRIWLFQYHNAKYYIQNPIHFKCLFCLSLGFDMNSGLNNHSGAFLSLIYVSKSPKSNFYIDSIEYQRPCDSELHKLSRIQGLVRWLSQCVKVLFFPAIHLTLILGPRIEENCFGHIVLWPSHAHRKREKEKKNTESWALVQGTFHDSLSVPSISW